jgi:hypothetical protein
LGALPSVPERKVASMFSSSVYVEVGDGTSTFFWTDAWLPDGAISKTAPNLFKAVGRRHLGRTVKDALFNRRWVRDITGARTAAVLLEYAHLWATLENVQLRPLESDRFVWRWTAGWSVLRSLGVQGALLRLDDLGGRQGTLARERPAQGEVLLLVGLAWAPLDR